MTPDHLSRRLESARRRGHERADEMCRVPGAARNVLLSVLRDSLILAEEEVDTIQVSLARAAAKRDRLAARLVAGDVGPIEQEAAG